MFTIKGIYAVKFYPNGAVSRNKSAFEVHLNSERGVMAFLDEQKPFAELEILDASNKNVTAYFVGE